MTTDLSPNFVCPLCMRPVGSHREDGGPWKPGDCHWCVYLDTLKAHHHEWAGSPLGTPHYPEKTPQ